MSVRQMLSAAIVVAFVTSVAVTPGWASPGAPSPSRASLGSPTGEPTLRGSIDRAVAETLSAPHHSRGGARPLLDQQSSGGGGGGGGWLIWTLVGTAASLGMGYYVMKQMRKTSTTPTTK